MLAKQIEKIDKVESKIKKMIPKTKFQLKKQIKLKKKADTLKSRSVKTLKRNEENQNKIEIETLEIGQNSNPSNNNNKITKERLKSYGMMKKI